MNPAPPVHAKVSPGFAREIMPAFSNAKSAGASALELNTAAM
jgi:hypothetical protein